MGNRNITEFNYRYSDNSTAHIFVAIQSKGAADLAAISAALTAAGLPNTNLTKNETAKIHIRYMVGGRTGKVTHERLFSFEFPKRPGALAYFLDRMQSGWNITLFHYLSHSSDYDRVLVGIDIPPADNQAFATFLQELGYVHTEQTDNTAYRLFLG